MVGQQHRETPPTTRQLPGWQLGQPEAEAYEQHLVPVFMAQGAQFLIEIAGLGAGERVLDVATGTGIVARTAAPRVGTEGKVAALDLNEHMLAVAQREATGVQPGIEWRIGDAQHLPYPDAAFDVVFCQQGLQFFPNRGAALAEFHRVLAPEGRVALSLMRPLAHNPSYEILASVVERYLGPEAAGILRSPFAALGAGDLRALLTDAGFQNVTIIIGIGPARYAAVEEFVTQEMGSSPLARAFAALPDHTRTALLQDAHEGLRAHLDDQGIVFPTEVYLVSGRR